MSDHVDFGDGTFFGQVVGKAEYRQQAPAPTALDALPPRAAGFTGRDEELGRLRTALAPSGLGSGAEQAVLVAAVSGLGGIGKTALAVQAAYAAREAGWFPGGVLFVDLHGYDDVPVSADQALQSLLRALGVEPEHIPATADERAGLYRSVLAEREAMLILADNASSPDQVRPLLPGGGPHRVLVTSRDRLPQLGARLVPLGQLTPGAAYGLLDRALRIADPDDGRVVAEAEAAARLAELCGHLPLALQIAVALLAEDPGRSVAELADELASSYDRLTALDDGDRSVRAAFDLSYRRLPPAQARLLRLLALAPGREVSEEVVAALVGAEGPPTAGLKALARAHLVERGSGRGWWRLQDLVRAYGARLGTGGDAVEDGEAARERVLSHYAQRAKAADDRLRWLPGMVEPESFADRAQALEWLDAERAGLVAAVHWAREPRYAAAAVSLGLRLGEYLAWRRYFDDLITISRTAAEAAHRRGDGVNSAVAWSNLGMALRGAGRMDEAMDAHSRARDLCQAAGHRIPEAAAWDGLGISLGHAGRLAEATDAHVRARDLYRAAGNQHGEAHAWGNLGNALTRANRDAEAIDAYTHTRDLFRATGDRHRLGMAWHNLGLVLQKTGRPDEAVEAHSKGVEYLLEFEDWHRLGTAFRSLADACTATGRTAEARTAHLRAADAYTRANAPKEAADARARADALTAPEEPTGTPVPGGPPGRTGVFGRRGPRPPGVPDSGGR
ncbi:tetratricopeptide repeat protein [Streptomyces echinatus]|uniref:tetratricopeptide repeat protein n=1 Tax=Streptomyces echinatus TaxID=67293 RepID=UPI00379D86BC